MKIAYFDCFAGISGDMILGAIIDAGYPLAQLNDDLAGLGIEGLWLTSTRVERHGLAATLVKVQAPHDHAHRGLHDVLALIESGGLPEHIRDKAGRIFRRLAEAESAVHGIPVDQVHFHEVGALDAIADVVGAVCGLHGLGVEGVYASQLRFGTGETRGAHGSLPIPVPAVVALCTGFAARRTNLPYELVTPTGAAILTTLADGIGAPVTMHTRAVGYGAGERDPEEIANVLRLEVGDLSDHRGADSTILIETNIDDTSPEIHGYLIERLLESGARDAWLAPVIMKKGRPGVVVSVLAGGGDVDALCEILFSETSTIGLRTNPVSRRILPRREDTIQTSLGPIRVKRIGAGTNERVAPEFEDCARVARELKVPILRVYEAVAAAAQKWTVHTEGDRILPVAP